MAGSPAARKAGIAVRTAAVLLSVLFALASGISHAQDASDPLAKFRACSSLERTERLQCMDKLLGNIAPPSRPTPAKGSWTISETTSPVDYSPIVFAVTPSRDGAEGSAMQLSISCRNGRTDLVIAGPPVSGRAEDYAISYRINGDEPVQAAAAASSFGTGAAFKGDIVSLLRSFPEGGDIAIRLAPRTGAAHEEHFSLGGLELVRAKVAAACKWPQAIAKPRN
jgi:hypothetical protein